MWKALEEERTDQLRDKLIAVRRENHLKCDHHHDSKEVNFSKIKTEFTKKFE